jgi:Arc/MetJ-type ribon-helix-helix transcriptional regulator
MTIQITVRLPDELVAFVDAEVERGDATSRADAVARALVRERRRRTALADVAILRGSPDDPDLDGLAEYTGAHPVPLDD